MENVLSAINTALDFTVKAKALNSDCLRNDSIRIAEYRRYVEAVYCSYHAWANTYQHRSLQELYSFSSAVAHKIGYVVYRLKQMQETNAIDALLPPNELRSLVCYCEELYLSVLPAAVPDAVQLFYDSLLENPDGHGKQ